MRFVPLVPLLTAIVFFRPAPAAGGVDEAISGCALRPEILALGGGCAGGSEPAELCAWLPVVSDLVAGEGDKAAAGLAAAFDLPPAVAARILAAARIYLLPMADDACPKEGVTALVGDLGSSGALQEAARSGGNAAIALQLRLMGFRPAALARMAARMGELGSPEATRACDGFYQLMVRSGVQENIADAFSGRNPVLTGFTRSGVIAAPAGGFSAELAAVAAPLGRVDAALELVARGAVGPGRQAIEETVADAPEAAKGLVLARAGWGYLHLYRLEDGLAMFAQARPWLEQSAPGDRIGRSALFLVAQGQKLAFHASGLPNRVPELASDPELGPLLELIGQALGAAGDAAKLEALLPQVLQMLFSGELEMATLQPFMLAVEASMPGLAGIVPAAPASAPAARAADGLPFFEQVELLLSGDSAGAAATWLDTASDNSHLNQLLSGMLVALASWKKGDLEAAREVLVQAMELVERQLATQRIDEMARSPFVDNLSSLAYLAATEITGLVGQPREAFGIAERGRAFTLRRRLGAPRLARPASELSAEEKGLVGEIARLDRGPAAARAQLPELYHRFENARLERLLAGAHGVAPAFPVPASLDSLQREVLAADEILLAYYPSLEGKLWLWRIDRGAAELHALELPGEGVFRCLAQSLRWRDTADEPRRRARARGVELLVECPGQPTGVDPAALLYEKLIGPVASRLETGRRLVVVPHGELHGVPFAALRDPSNGRRLGESYELAIEPSADTLARLRRPRPAPAAAVPGVASFSRTRRRSMAAKEVRRENRRGKPLVLGDPITPFARLPAARGEAEAVAKLLGVKPLLGKDATEAALFAKAPEATLLHIAAHGTYVPESPLFSAIQLAEGDGQDGALHVHEVWDRLDLRNVRLVVLSACDTAAGEPTRGDEILGLTQAFLVAGAPAVIATLWPVDDTASAQLMTEFYRRFQQGETAAAALRAAQRLLLQDPKTAAPYFWAGYTLVGDPDARWQDSPAGKSSP